MKKNVLWCLFFIVFLLPTIILASIHTVWCDCPVPAKSLIPLNSRCTCKDDYLKVTGAVTFGLDGLAYTDVEMHCTNHPHSKGYWVDALLGKNDFWVVCGAIPGTSNQIGCHNGDFRTHHITVKKAICRPL